MRNGLAILSLHDVSPAFSDQVVEILTQMEQWGLPPPALLIVPNHHGDWPVNAYDDFANVVLEAQKKGSELLLHGYEHIAPENAPLPINLLKRVKAGLLTAGEGEFHNVGMELAVRKLRIGRGLLEQGLGVRPSGFVAPAWLESRHTQAALAFEGFEFHEDHLFVRRVSTDEKHFIPAVSFSARSPLRTFASRIWARALRLLAFGKWNLRLAIHPLDFSSEELKNAIRRFAEAATQTRQWVTYEQFLRRTKQCELY
ncbi:MAG: DUF2334 domain-containing protein [Proteobacteria bacterium]|nr:DUF2334 domain-containing protein [Pseudomonadota bacterium]